MDLVRYMNKYERIKKECFWDYEVTPEEIGKLFTDGTKAEKKKLFDKIMYNSSDKLADLMLFSSDELKEFLNEFMPTYNKRYIMKHVNALKYLLLNEKVAVEGLRWREK